MQIFPNRDSLIKKQLFGGFIKSKSDLEEKMENHTNEEAVQKCYNDVKILR
jgi:hypothetical protein